MVIICRTRRLTLKSGEKILENFPLLSAIHPISFNFYSDDRAKKSKQEEEYYGLAQTYGYSPEDLGVDSGRGFGRGRGGRGGGGQAPYPMGGRGGFGGGQGGYQTTPLSYFPCLT